MLIVDGRPWTSVRVFIGPRKKLNATARALELIRVRMHTLFLPPPLLKFSYGRVFHTGVTAYRVKASSFLLSRVVLAWCLLRFFTFPSLSSSLCLSLSFLGLFSFFFRPLSAGLRARFNLSRLLSSPPMHRGNLSARLRRGLNLIMPGRVFLADSRV